MRGIPFAAPRFLAALAAAALIGAPHSLYGGVEAARPTESKPSDSKPAESKAADSNPTVSKPSHLFIGRVSGSDLKAIAKARVTMVATPKNAGGTGRAIERSYRSYAWIPAPEDKPVFYAAVSDEQGQFRVELPSSGPWNLRAQADGLAPAVIEHVNASGASSATPRAISLQAGSAIRGSVYDGSRKTPLEGAKVLARPRVDRGFNDWSDPERFCQAAAAGRDGSFVVTNLAPNTYDLEVTAPGHALYLVQNVTTEESRGEPITIYLTSGFSVAGRVADRDLKGIAGVVLTADLDYRVANPRSQREAIGGIFALSTKTDEKGRFRMDGFPQVAGLGLVIASPDGARSRHPLEDPRDRNMIPDVEIVLDRSSAMTGRLVDAEGAPPRKASLTVSFRDAENSPPAYQRTVRDMKLGEKGEFSVRGLPSGNCRIAIRAEGFKTPETRTASLESAKTAELGTIAIERGRTVRGHVSGPDSKPIAGATVFAEGNFGTTDADGNYLLGGLADHPSTIQVRAEGYAPQTRESVQADSEGIDFVLTLAGGVSGRVVTGDPAKPVTSYQIEALRKGTEEPVFNFRADTRAFSDPVGRFTLSDLDTGEYSLEVRAPGFAPLLREGVTVKEGEIASVGDLVLRPGAAVHGRVVNREGSPVAGASVRVRSGGLFSADAYAASAGRASSLLTDPSGRFTIRGLAAGSQTLVAEHPDYARTETTSRAEPGVEGEDVTLTLGTGGRITGTVRDDAGHLVQGANVGAVVMTDPFATDHSTRTDEQGRYTIEKLQSGSLTVWCQVPSEASRSAGGSKTAKQTVVKESETTVVDFGGEKGIRVSGTVRRKDGPFKDARLTFMPAEIERMISNMPRDARTREDGAYEVTLAEAGKFIVTISAGGQGSQRGTSFDVQVPDQSEFHRDFTISEGGISGTVVADADDKPLPGAKAMAFLMRKPDGGLVPQPSGEATTGADGRYGMEGLAAGVYRVIVTKQGFAPEEIEGLVLKADGSLTADAQLRPGKRLVVRIADSEGRPVPGAVVGLLDSDGLPVPWMSGPGTFTGKDGAVTFDNVREESYALFAFTRGMALGVLRGVSVAGEEEATARMRMTPGGSLSVKCTDTDGGPIAACAVSLVEPTGIDLGPYLPLMRLFEGLPAVSGADGVLSFPRLAPGRYRVTALGAAGARAEGSADVNEGEASNLTLKLRSK